MRSKVSSVLVSVTVWASDFRSSGCGFDHRPGRNQVT